MGRGTSRDNPLIAEYKVLQTGRCGFREFRSRYVVCVVPVEDRLAVALPGIEGGNGHFRLKETQVVEIIRPVVDEAYGAAALYFS